MEQEEKRGSVFMDFVNDYARVVRSEAIREFSFMPDDRCDEPDNFERELLKYGKENGKTIIITKKSRSPHFMMDGKAVSYTHLDVYKRQEGDRPQNLRNSNLRRQADELYCGERNFDWRNGRASGGTCRACAAF